MKSVSDVIKHKPTLAVVEAARLHLGKALATTLTLRLRTLADEWYTTEHEQEKRTFRECK
jgi:hypothetical protein